MDIIIGEEMVNVQARDVGWVRVSWVKSSTAWLVSLTLHLLTTNAWDTRRKHKEFAQMHLPSFLTSQC